MGIIQPAERRANRNAASTDPVLSFSQGEISRRQAMRALGDIDYGELIDLLSRRGLKLPELPPEEIDRMAKGLNKLLDAAGR
jgi:hypothetical protein